MVETYNREDFKNGCPKCGSNKFLRGPRGGLSQMFMCAGCKTEYVAYPTGEIEVVKR